VCVGGAGIYASKVALAIAVRYALQRRQFGSPGGPEELLLDYGLHQRRLFVPLARTYALHFAQEVLAGQLHAVFSATQDVDEHTRRALESRAAGTKALGTRHASTTIQECREACGGAGYLSANRFDALRADTDVFTTFEGDNHILLQLVAKGLLTDYSSSFSAPRCTRCWSGSRTCCPAATTPGTRRPGSTTRRTSWRCSAGARSTCWPGWRAGSSAAWTPAWSRPRCSAAARAT
jgi:hypothetical protein